MDKKSKVLSEIFEIDHRRDFGYGGDAVMCKKDSRRRKLLVRRLNGNDIRWEVAGDVRGVLPKKLKDECKMLSAPHEILNIIKEVGNV